MFPYLYLGMRHRLKLMARQPNDNIFCVQGSFQNYHLIYLFPFGFKRTSCLQMDRSKYSLFLHTLNLIVILIFLPIKFTFLKFKKKMCVAFLRIQVKVKIPHLLKLTYRYRICCFLLEVNLLNFYRLLQLLP